MYATVLSNYTFYYLEKLHIHTHAHTQIQEETDQWIKVIKIRQNKAENEQRNEK